MKKRGRIGVIGLVLFELRLLLLLLLSVSLSITISEPNVINSLPGYPANLPFKLETGYVGVGEKEEVQLFYYFTESEGNVESDPLMLWLTGGPGCSAFSGLIFEIGPLAFNLSASNSEWDIPQLQPNPYSWTKVASIIFVDSPVGTGFSYSTTAQANHSTATLQSTQIYEFLRKWLIKHPKFTNNPLYISGDSYSGIVVPVIVQHILQGNKIGIRPKLNLKGYVLGNPSTRRDQGAYKYAHRISLLSDELYKSAMLSCKGDFVNVDTNNTECSTKLQAIKRDINSVNYAHVLERGCPFVFPKHFDKPSWLHITAEICREQHYSLASTWANNEQVREALGIKEGSIGDWVRCSRNLVYESNVRSSFEYHLNFTRESLEVLIYSGDQDRIVPYVGTLEWIMQLSMPITDDWRPWFVDGQVAGYSTEFSRSTYRLVYTTVKGGGHTAPEYKPRECLAMIDRWFSLSPL